MQTARLLRLAKFLRTSVPTEQFDMSSWAGNKNIPFDESLSCGTSACAMGWATTIPAFKKLGLSLKKLEGRPHSHEAQIHYKDLSSYEAVQVFMGLTESQTKRLFAPSYYDNPSPTRWEVADRIEELVRSQNEIGNEDS